MVTILAPTRSADRRPRKLPDEIPHLLDRLRRRIRAYLLWQSAARLALLAAALFWLGLAIDWFFEPARGVRTLELIAATTAAISVLVASAWRIARAPLGAKNLALLLERRFPRLGESLLTIVDLAEQPGSTGFADELIDATARRATAELAQLDLRQVFNLRPLAWRLALASVALGAVGVLAVAAPATTRLYLSRALLLSDAPWPRDTRLSVEGFHDGQARIARGSDFLVNVKADSQGVVPDRVRLWYRAPGDSWVSVDLPKRSDGDAGAARFEHPLTSVIDSLDLEIRGGDARLRDLRLEVVDPPQVSSVELVCRYPKYLGRAEARLPLATVGPLPIGTAVVARLGLNRPVREAIWQADGAERGQRRTFDEPAAAFEIDLGVLGAKPAPLSLELVDADGIRSLPWRLELTSVEDQTPKVDAQPRGLGAAITPQARIVWRGKANDDYGLAQLGWATRGSDGAESIAPLADLAEALREAPIDAAFEVAPLNLKPGDQLQLAVAARDDWDLGPEPHVGYSEWIVRKVVEPDELRSDLEARELNLRRRVEKVSGDLDALAESLSQLETQAADDEARQAQRLQTERGLEDVRQARGELRSVAAALAELRDEGVNNQVLNDEARSRLDDGVIQPLEQLADQQGSRLAERLAALREAIAQNTPDAAADRDAAAAENDEARRQVQRILERMRQRETLHEVVELLRGILRDQTEVNSATRQQRQKGLLEELGE